MGIIFIFIDGLGIGEDDISKNPVKAASTPNIDHITSHFKVFPTDACLGVPGLPQSATGQTAIFTGVNASIAVGRHISGQPDTALKKIINENNLFIELAKRGYSFTNSNVYRDKYLESLLSPENHTIKPSVTSVMTLSSGIKPRTVEDYKKGNGIYHDITGNILKESGFDVDIISPKEAALRLFNISRNYSFTLFEHFMSDIVGHSMDMELAKTEIELLDEFLGGLFNLLDFEKDIVVITSDHGNIEDISLKTHTFNKVPTVVAGIPDGLDIRIESLTDIMPAVLNMIGAK
ncbi:MAG TPA: peptidase [Clostridia bacterium]